PARASTTSSAASSERRPTNTGDEILRTTMMDTLTETPTGIQAADPGQHIPLIRARLPLERNPAPTHPEALPPSRGPRRTSDHHRVFGNGCGNLGKTGPVASVPPWSVETRHLPAIVAQAASYGCPGQALPTRFGGVRPSVQARP